VDNPEDDDPVLVRLTTLLLVPIVLTFPRPEAVVLVMVDPGYIWLGLLVDDEGFRACN